MNKPLFVTTKKLKNTREENQDEIYLDTRKGILLVADGMGGKNHSRGRQISWLAVDRMKDFLAENYDMLKTGLLQENEISEWLRKSVMKTNDYICDIATTESFKNGGTTLEAMHLHNNILHYTHVGDSTTFIIKPHDRNKGLIGSIEKLAEEHNSLPESPIGHIEKYIGMNDLRSEDVDLKKIPLQKYDIIFSCTDGVTKPLTQGDLLEVFTTESIRYAPIAIMRRILQPVQRKEELEEKELGQTIKNYMGDNASFIIYQAGE